MAPYTAWQLLYLRTQNTFFSSTTIRVRAGGAPQPGADTSNVVVRCQGRRGSSMFLFSNFFNVA